MTVTALAAVSELEVRIGVGEGSLSGVDLARAQAALDDVSAEVLDVAGVSWDIDSVPASVRRVVLAAAKRVWLNPQDLASEQAGDYAWRANVRGGDLLTAAEVDRIKDSAGRSDAYEMVTALPADHLINAPWWEG